MSEELKPTAWALYVRRADTDWTRYMLYDTEYRAVKTMRQIQGEPLIVEIRPLYESHGDTSDYKSMFQQAVRTLAAIDEALGLGEDGCADPDETLTAIEELKRLAETGKSLALSVMSDHVSDDGYKPPPAELAAMERYRKISTAAMCCHKIEFNHGGPVYDAAGGIMDSFDPEATVVSGSGQRFHAETIEAALLEMYAAEFEP